MGQQGRTEWSLWRSKQGPWPPTGTTSKNRLALNPQGQENNPKYNSHKSCAKSFACVASSVKKSVHYFSL